MSLDPPNFTQQVAVVTGASGGIGGAIATALVQLGATVYAVGRDQDRLEALATRLSSALGTVRLQRADLKRDDEVSALVAEVERSAGRLDILVHSAGSIAYGKLEETPVQTLDDLYTGNVRAPYLLTQKLLGMLQSAAGQIVFINSSVGLAASATLGPYAATQHALKALADALRAEVNAAGVRVLSVYPGRTATALMLARFSMEGRAYRPELLLQPEDVANVVISSLALPRTAEVTNINIRPMVKSY